MIEERYYAISYYGERFKLGYIEMDFIDCKSVDKYVNEKGHDFWNNVKIITADVPVRIYNRLFGDKQKTFDSSDVLYSVSIIEQTGKHGFKCITYDPITDEERDIRIKLESPSMNSNQETKDRLRSQFELDRYSPYDKEGPKAEKQAELLSRKTNYYKFKVYNVGQGLATSLQINDDIPFLYFDYGIGESCPDPGPSLPVSTEATVIYLSHVDKDHWYGYKKNSNALQCTWVVPLQAAKARFYSFLNKVMTTGGNVYTHKNDIDLGAVYIGNSKSTISPSRIPKPTHQDGFAMYINGFVTEEGQKKKCRITVAGDQDYDYQDSARYSETDVLIACHHGGEYCWSTRFPGIFPADDKSVIVYSYGKPNKHGHPSKCNDYSMWMNRLDTPTANDSFEWTIQML